MADDVVGIVLVLLEEVGDAREGNLVDVFVNLLLGHADTVVADGDGTLVGIEVDAYGQVAQIVLVLTVSSEGLHLLCGVDGVADHLAEEYLMIAVEKLFDDGEDVLSRNPDVTFLHSVVFISSCFRLLPVEPSTVRGRRCHQVWCWLQRSQSSECRPSWQHGSSWQQPSSPHERDPRRCGCERG